MKRYQITAKLYGWIDGIKSNYILVTFSILAANRKDAVLIAQERCFENGTTYVGISKA